MPNLESVRFRLGRFRPSFLPALLIVALAVTGIVTFHAYKASKEHREALESVLSAYMSFAAQRVQEATQQGIQSCAEWLLVPAIRAPKLSLDNVRREGCLVMDGIAFELDLASRRVTTPAELKSDIARWMLDTLPRHPTFEGEGERAIGTIVRASRRPEIVFYILESKDGIPVRAMGIVSH